MGVLKKAIKNATKPLRNKMKGNAGEDAVDSKLNPLLFGKVNHRSIRGLIITDSNGATHQIDEIEIRENGIFCIEVKNYSGWVFGSDESKEWTVTYSNGEKHKFYNPLKQNRSHVYQMYQVLGDKHHITSLVVMANNNADKVQSDYVINLSDLKSWLKGYNDGTHLTDEEMEEIYQTLRSSHAWISNREHVKNVKQSQKDMKDGVCPRCGGELLLRKGKYGDFYGCANYPKCSFKISDKDMDK